MYDGIIITKMPRKITPEMGGENLVIKQGGYMGKDIFICLLSQRGRIL